MYGFDCGKKYKFVKLVFGNMSVFNKVKNMWFNNPDSFKRKKLKEGGLEYKDNKKTGHIWNYMRQNYQHCLRFFHIQDISPSGWVEIKKKKVKTKANIM